MFHYSNANATPGDETYGDALSFEFVTPPTTPTSNNDPSVPRSKRRRCSRKTPPRIHKSSRPSDQQNLVSSFARTSVVWYTMVVVVVLCFFLMGAISRAQSFFSQDQHIQELRLEFRREIESLRSEVQHDLVPHLLATAELETKAKLKAIELEDQRERAIEASGPHNENEKSHSVDQAFYTTKMEPSFDIPALGFLLKGKVGTAYFWMEHRLQSMEIRSSLESLRETMFGKLHIMYMIVLDSWDSAQNIVLPYAQSIFVAVVASSTRVQNAIHRHLRSIYDNMISSDWTMLNPKLVHAIEFANQHRLEFCAWYALSMWFLYKCYRLYSDQNNDDHRNRRANNKANTFSPSATNDERNSDEFFESANHDGSDDDPEERTEDVMMEHMLNESMAAAGWPVVVARTNTNRQPSTSGSNTNSNGRITKKERRRLARINAQNFAARDKQRLARGRAAAAPVVAHSPMISDRGTPTPPRAPAPSLWASRKARLQQARANAEKYAKQDRQRLQRARRNRNI